MRADSSDKPLPFLVLTFLLLALVWNLFVPPYENLDELEHVEVVRHLLVRGELPVHGEAEARGFRVRQEASQPPLYYMLAALWARLWGLPTDAPDRSPVPADVVACGPSGYFYDKATWKRDPYRDVPPWRGADLLVHGLRLFSTFLQTATLVGTWRLGRRLFPRGPVPLLATVIVAFNPQFLLVASGVNNDNLVTPLATWGLVLAYDIWQRGPTQSRVVGFGTLAALAALSKLSGLALLPLGGVALLAWTWRVRPRRPLRNLARWGVLMGFPVLVLLFPWMRRNAMLYGDPTALAPMLAVVGRRQSSFAAGELVQTFLSFWGQMPCSFYPRAFYWPYFVLVAVGVMGGVSRRRAGLGLAVLWFALVAAAWLRWNSLTAAPGGRLLFPAAPALALVLAAGWAGLRRLRGSRLAVLWSAFLPVWSLVGLRLGPIGFFAPPPRLLSLTPPIPPVVTFGEAIVLRSGEARIVHPLAACLFASADYCGPTLDLTLVWEAVAPIAEDWVMAVQLVSPVPGETALRLNYNHWPGRGNLPTSVWSVGVRLRDAYLLPLPPGDAPTQAWRLQVAFFDGVSGERLPVRVDGVAAGDAASLALLRVPGASISLPDDRAFPTPVTFGEAVFLHDLRLRPEATGWQVTLLWEDVAPLSEDYTVFVHVYAADGTLLSTGDAPPWHFPTHLWQPGDRVETVHYLPGTEGVSAAYIAVGLYRPGTGERLPARRDGARLPDDAAVAPLLP